MGPTKIGPCAKKEVVCVLVLENGERISGDNYCLNAQDTCPREPWEGYEKCSSICRQVGHAEEVALLGAGARAHGARAFLMGNSYFCRNCQERLFEAGVKSISVVADLNEIP